MSVVMHDINVIQTHTNLVSSRIVRYQSYTASVVCDEGYSIYEITIKMGGVDITSTAYDATYNMISIPSVTGDVDIKCYAMHTMPSDYIRVDGIKNPSNAFMSTEYRMPAHSIAFVDCTRGNSNSSDVGIFNSRPGGVTGTRSGGITFNSGVISVGAWPDSATYFGYTSIGVTPAVGARFTVTLDKQNGKVLYNNVVKRTFTPNDTSARDASPMTLFALEKWSYGHPENSAGYIIHFVSIKEENAYVRYYIPCLNASGVAGFWDAARGVFQGSSNSTAFEPVTLGYTAFTGRNTADDSTLPGTTAEIISIRGNSLTFNQLFAAADSVVTTTSGHKYLTKIGETYSIVTSTGEDISATTASDMLIDLTLMFGAGKEPATTTEFVNLFPYYHYDYDEGTMLHFKGTELATTGVNIWNEDWEVGTYNIETGDKANNNKFVRSKNAINIIPGRRYTMWYGPGGTTASPRVIWYNKNGGYIGYSSTRYPTFPRNAVYMRFSSYSTYGNVYNNDFTWALGTDDGRQTNKRFNGKTITLNITSLSSNETVIFPEGMKRIGTVFDEVVKRTDGWYAIQRISRTGYTTLGTPQEYLLDQEIDGVYPIETHGTEILYPRNFDVPSTAPAIMVINYNKTT